MLARFHLTVNYSGSWALKMDQQGLLHWILRTEFVPIKLSMWKQMKNENAMLWNAPDASDLELMDLRKRNQLWNPILAPQIHVQHLRTTVIHLLYRLPTFRRKKWAHNPLQTLMAHRPLKDHHRTEKRNFDWRRN